MHLHQIKEKIKQGIEAVKTKLEGRFEPLKTVDRVRINKLTGTWFIQARKDQFLSEQVYNVTINFSMSLTSKILHQLDAHLSGNEGNPMGKRITLSGKVKARNDYFSKLDIQFHHIYREDFFILDYAADYSWVLVGAEDRKLAWILSRRPFMKKGVLDTLLRKLEVQQFDIATMQLVRQLEIPVAKSEYESVYEMKRQYKNRKMSGPKPGEITFEQRENPTGVEQIAVKHQVYKQENPLHQHHMKPAGYGIDHVRGNEVINRPPEQIQNQVYQQRVQSSSSSSLSSSSISSSSYEGRKHSGNPLDQPQIVREVNQESITIENRNLQQIAPVQKVQYVEQHIIQPQQQIYVPQAGGQQQYIVSPNENQYQQQGYVQPVQQQQQNMRVIQEIRDESTNSMNKDFGELRIGNEQRAQPVAVSQAMPQAQFVENQYLYGSNTKSKYNPHNIPKDQSTYLYNEGSSSQSNYQNRYVQN